MRALLLSAGRGARLGEITKKIPKCLIKINNTTLLEQWIMKLLEVNVTNILINTHHQHFKIKKFLKKKNYRNKIKITYEKKLLGNYGTLYKNKKIFSGEDFLVIHSDNYFDGSLKNFISFCKKNLSFKICLLAFKTNDYKNSGILNISKKNILKKIYEKKKIKRGIWANSAVYYFSKNTIKDLEKEKRNFDIAKDLLKKYYGRAIVYKTKKFFIDVGIKENLKKLNYSL